MNNKEPYAVWIGRRLSRARCFVDVVDARPTAMMVMRNVIANADAAGDKTDDA